VALDLDRIRALEFADLRQSYTARDTILYALGLGYGTDPLDPDQLRFVYEDGLQVVPSMCSILCQPGFWARDPVYGVDWVKVLHAEQGFEMLAPLPPSGNVAARVRVVGVEDKGAEKGALLHQVKELSDEHGTPLARVRTTIFLRGNGGQGGFGERMEVAPALPDREPDRVVEIPTSRRAAMIYRLSGDWNPLHADPRIAAQAGFREPILHGLCTFGIACRALVSEYCGGDPTRLRTMFARFSRPVFPGETIVVQFFEEGGIVRFRALAAERDVIVLDRCSAAVA
jgi:acyl dehydratase